MIVMWFNLQGLCSSRVRCKRATQREGWHIQLWGCRLGNSKRSKMQWSNNRRWCTHPPARTGEWTHTHALVWHSLLSTTVLSSMVTSFLWQAWRLYESDSLLDLVENNLNVNAEEARKVIQIGLMCTQSASLRPTMSDVVTLLMCKDHPRFQLSRPSFMSGNPTPNRNSAQNSTSSGSSMSHANMTISMFTGRWH